MATYDDVARLVLVLPEVAEGEHHGHRTWTVLNKVIAWERPFSKADIKRYGTEVPPAGPILAVTVEDESEKAAALAAHPDAVFTISHFDGYAAILLQLDLATDDLLAEVLLDGWLAAAPAALVREHLEELGLGDRADES